MTDKELTVNITVVICNDTTVMRQHLEKLVAARFPHATVYVDEYLPGQLQWIREVQLRYGYIAITSFIITGFGMPVIEALRDYAKLGVPVFIGTKATILPAAWDDIVNVQKVEV